MYNLFISHAWKYNSEYYNLVDMLNKASYFSWKNYSVPQHDALDTRTDKELDEALHRQISPCSCVLRGCIIIIDAGFKKRLTLLIVMENLLL